MRLQESRRTKGDNKFGNIKKVIQRLAVLSPYQ